MRGRKRAIADIECWVLEDYDPVKVADNEYNLEIPHETDGELDQLVEALLDDIQSTADDRHCFSESCARTIDGDRNWS